MGLLVSKLSHKHKQQQQQQEELKSDHELAKMDTKFGGNKELVTAIETKSITTIYYDCLERILDSLDLDDLLSVAQTCKRLQIAAAANFKDRFGKMAVVLIPKNTINDFKGFRTDESHIYIFEMKFCLPFLRCFGSKILDLHVVHTNTHAHYYHVDNYINQYCADTLQSIEYVSRGQEFSDESFRKPFKKVETGIIMYCNLKQLPNFVHWFPNLRHLEIDDLSIHNCVPACLPSLKHLSIDFTYDFMEECIEDFLHENPQLQSIEFAIGYNVEIEMAELLNMIRENTSITNLVRYNYDTKNGISHVSEEELLRLGSEHPGMVELELHDCLLNGENAIHLFCQMNALKEFRFQIKDKAECDLLVTKLDSNWEHRIEENDNAQYIVTLKKN